MKRSTQYTTVLVATVTLATLFGGATTASAATSAVSTRTPIVAIAEPTTAEGQLRININGATVTLRGDQLVYTDTRDFSTRTESLKNFVAAGGKIAITRSTQIVLTAPLNVPLPHSRAAKKKQGWAGSWDECISGLIGGGGLAGLVGGPLGIGAGMVGGAASALLLCNGKRMMGQ